MESLISSYILHLKWRNSWLSIITKLWTPKLMENEEGVRVGLHGSDISAFVNSHSPFGPLTICFVTQVSKKYAPFDFPAWQLLRRSSGPHSKSRIPPETTAHNWDGPTHRNQGLATWKWSMEFTIVLTQENVTVYTLFVKFIHRKRKISSNSKTFISLLLCCN